MAPPCQEFHDIQGILRFGYGKLEEASFLLLRITDSVEAKAWLAAAAGDTGAYHVTRVSDLDSYQEQALQVAFTAPGLRKLGVKEDLLKGESNDTFSHEFYLGMASAEAGLEGRFRRLGDIGKNAPAKWEWGAPGDTPDVLVMLYAEAGSLNAFQQMVVADLALGFEVLRVLRSADAAQDQDLRREPFGFVDGISDPTVDWDGSRLPGTSADLEYGNLIAAGEFLLGYPNEYGLYTQRPLLNPELDPENILAPAEDNPGKRDLGRNGTYLVLRQLEQDVPGFWRFVSAKSPDDGGVSLAEAMVGRRLATGDPLIAASGTRIHGVGKKARDIRLNDFTFESDSEGLACPFGAHIRRANPRTGDMPGGRQGFAAWLLRTLSLPPLLRRLGLAWLLRMLGVKDGGPREDLLSSSRFHRIIRRGRPFGAVIDRESALKDEHPGFATGIYFIALNSNISRQFEFIQNAWIINAKFNGLNGEADPLLGNRLPFPGDHPTSAFSLPQSSGPNRQIAGLPQFVTMRGGAYFFLPGLRALRFIARQSEKG